MSTFPRLSLSPSPSPIKRSLAAHELPVTHGRIRGGTSNASHSQLRNALSLRIGGFFVLTSGCKNSRPGIKWVVDIL